MAYLPLQWMSFYEAGVLFVLLSVLLFSGRSKRLQQVVVGKRFVKKSQRQSGNPYDHVLSAEVLVKLDSRDLITTYREGELSLFTVCTALALKGVASVGCLSEIVPLLQSGDSAHIADCVGVIAGVGFRAGYVAKDLVKLLAHEDSRVRESVLVAIASMGPAAGSLETELIESYDSLESEQKVSLIYALGCLRSWDAVGHFLIGRLVDREDAVVEAACWAFEKMENAPQILVSEYVRLFLLDPIRIRPEPLTSFASKKIVQEVLATLATESDPRVRVELVRSLRVMRSVVSEEYVGELAKFLEDEDERVIGVVARTLNHLVAEVPLLNDFRAMVEEYVEDDSELDSEQLAASLQLRIDYGIHGERFESRLDELLSNEYFAVRANAVELATKYSSSVWLNRISGMLMDRSPIVRSKVAEAFEVLYDGESSLEVLLTLVRDRDAVVRERALRSLAAVQGKQLGCMQYFEAALDDLSLRVRKEAAIALGSTDQLTQAVKRRIIDELRQVVIVSSKPDRDRARTALNYIGTDDAIAASRL